MLENDNVNDKNADEMINMPEQDSNLSSYRKPICIYRPAERRRSFIQHINIQMKGANNIF